MALEFLGTLFAGDNKTGASRFVGVGHADRYNPVTAGELTGSGLYANIHSADLFTTAEADGNLVFLKNDDFSGAFAQASDAASVGDAWWHISGHIGSVISVAGNRKGKHETRLSFHDQFLSQWTTFLDSALAGSRASRQGEPTLTWEMFPATISYLNPDHTYLKIYQPLHISMPWPFSDYAASMTYHIQLFVDGSHHLRAWGARWAYWVESGIKAGHIGDSLEPQVRDGLTTLVNQVNAKISVLDALGSMSDVYYLPGKQLTRIGTGFITGNTNDDVTIVVEH
jgi:hypothetical protein